MIEYKGPERYEVINNILRNNGLLDLYTGIEIGVRHGEFTEFLLRNNKKLKMLCVDSYPVYLDVEHQYTKEEQDELYKATKKRLLNYGDRCTFLRQDSLAVAPTVIDGSADFVFIDAEHTKEAVEKDIMAWYPKVRSKGMLSGHDYSMVAVKEVVNDWAAKFGKTVIHSDTNSDIWAIEI